MSEEQPLTVKESENEELDVIVLFSGESLSIDETYHITASEENQFIVVMGATGSGKTTLVASLYQLFLCRCGCNDYYFAGSETLMAFEERSFYTRVQSNSPQPVTPRTPRGSLKDALHLRLMNKNSCRANNFLFSDFSGEDLEAVVANPEIAREEFPLVKSAKRILLLIDGKKLSGIRHRAAEIQRAIQMLKTFINADLVSEKAEIVLIISKYDLVLASQDDISKSLSLIILEDFKKQIPQISNRIQIVCTAAMPENKEIVAPYYGLEELLSLMTQKLPIMAASSEIVNNSQFELWGMRHDHE